MLHYACVYNHLGSKTPKEMVVIEVVKDQSPKDLLGKDVVHEVVHKLSLIGGDWCGGTVVVVKMT